MQSQLTKPPAGVEAQGVQPHVVLNLRTQQRRAGGSEAAQAGSDDALPEEKKSGNKSKPFHSFLEHSATYTFPFLFALTLYLSAEILYEADSAWLIIPAIPLSFVLGDFISGLLHWAADTYCSEDTPVIGHSLIKPFRMHHVDPKDICSHGLVSALGNTCILAVPLLALCLVVLFAAQLSAFGAVVIFTAAVTIGLTVATNQFHKWAHQDEPRRVVRLLQKSRMILGPRHHDGHHAEPFDSNYSITNGWLNPLFNKVGFYRKLERALRMVGIKTSK